MNISNSRELQSIITERNEKQLVSDDALFGDAPSKKRKKVTLDSDDFNGYVTLRHSVEGLMVKKASKSREGIHIPLLPDQLKLLFDFLTSEGSDCIGTKSRRNYEKTGKFKSRGSIFLGCPIALQIWLQIPNRPFLWPVHYCSGVALTLLH